MARALVKVHSFYDSIGGIVGYQRKCLELLLTPEESESTSSQQLTFHLPCGPNLATDQLAASKATATGLEALPRMAEIYPVGGKRSHSSCLTWMVCSLALPNVILGVQLLKCTCL